MIPIDNDTVLLLRRLQRRLAEEGHRVQGEMMGKVADRIAAAGDVDIALERLYSLHGWDTIALRLMWYAKRTRVTETGTPLDFLIDFEVDELHKLLMSAPQGNGGQQEIHREPGKAALTGEVFEALHQFNSALEDLKRSAFEGEQFHGMRQGFVDSALSQAGRLHQICSSSGNETLGSFAAAFSLFLRYVIGRDLFDDVRVAHLIENASQSLHGLMESSGTEDYDALVQTIEMLHNPETLLE